MKTLLAVGFCVVVAGCGKAVQSTEPVKINRVFSAPQKAVWQGRIEAVAEKGVSIQSSDINSGTMTTNQIIVKGAINSGSSNQPKYSLGLKILGAQSTRVERATVIAIMTGTDGAVRIKIKVNIQASAGNRQYLSWKPVSSNGKLEDEILRGISATIGGN